jgi:cytochrome c-type protein NapC
MPAIRFLLKLAATFLILGVVVAGSWALMETAIGKTSDLQFCTTCHSMSPMGKSYEQDGHGGNNANGIRVECTECHLPHDSPLGYLLAKARTGAHDIWAELTRDTDTIDWESLREHRKRYVHDSGCLHCHSHLQRATEINNKAFVAHRPYFLGKTDKQCVSCHEHVGHHELGDYLNTAQQSGGGS